MTTKNEMCVEMTSNNTDCGEGGEEVSTGNMESDSGDDVEDEESLLLREDHVPSEIAMRITTENQKQNQQNYVNLLATLIPFDLMTLMECLFCTQLYARSKLIDKAQKMGNFKNGNVTLDYFITIENLFYGSFLGMILLQSLFAMLFMQRTANQAQKDTLKSAVITNTVTTIQYDGICLVTKLFFVGYFAWFILPDFQASFSLTSDISQYKLDRLMTYILAVDILTTVFQLVMSGLRLYASVPQKVSMVVLWYGRHLFGNLHTINTVFTVLLVLWSAFLQIFFGVTLFQTCEEWYSFAVPAYAVAIVVTVFRLLCVLRLINTEEYMQKLAYANCVRYLLFVVMCGLLTPY